jgi:hypothetical protein
MAEIKVNGQTFLMSQRSYDLMMEGARMAEEARREQLVSAGCLCPGDCNCRHQGAPYYRTNFCGCRAHEVVDDR